MAREDNGLEWDIVRIPPKMGVDIPHDLPVPNSVGSDSQFWLEVMDGDEQTSPRDQSELETDWRWL